MLDTASLLAFWLDALAAGGGLWGAVLAFMVGLEMVHFAVDLVRGQ